MNRSQVLGIVLVGAIVLLAVMFWQQVSRAQPTTPGYVRVTKVFDGDTFEVSLPEGKKKVRMLGVNTPESVDPNRPVQCFGPEASSFTKAHLGPEIRLEVDPTRGEDKYGRWLRYVYTRDGGFFNLRLIQEGYAKEYTFQNQRYAYQSEFKTAEAQAKATGAGLWSPQTCNGDTNRSAPIRTS